MHINAHRVDDTLTLGLTGRLDTTTAPVLERELGLEGIRHLVLDFGECPYISSVGLRELLRAQKRLTTIGGTMLLINVTR